MMTAHLTAPPPRATAVNPQLPAAVDRVLARAMAKNPSERFGTCSLFVAALAAAFVDAGSADNPAFPSPPPLARSGDAKLVRPAGHLDTLAPRVGHTPGGPMVLPFAAGPVAVRGDVRRGIVREVAARQGADAPPRP